MVLKDFYTVVSSNCANGNYSTTIRINKNNQIYKGHFPDRPVSPGVILMQLFKEEMERLTHCSLQLKTASNVKFTAVVDPNKDENLILNSTFEEKAGTIILKGIAENNNCIALKINAVYNINK